MDAATPYTATGEQIELASAGYRATVVSVGAGLRELTFEGRPLIAGYAADVPVPVSRGTVLAPWPNRVEDGRWSFDGVHHQLPVNEVERGNALHGLVFDQEWAVRDRDDASATLALRAYPRAGYPFRLDLEIRYALGPGGLEVQLSATNSGPRPAPYGCGFHPYLTAGTPTVDGAVLTVAADRYLEVTPDRLLPVEVVPSAGTPFDFSGSTRLDGLFVDHAFTGLGRGEDGLGRLTLLDGDSGAGVQLWWDESYPWLQVHTGDRPEPELHRSGLAVEPLTCPPDAFNSGDDLVVLGPGERHSGRWGIGAVPAS